jgi:hypothetical protein
MTLLLKIAAGCALGVLAATAMLQIQMLAMFGGGVLGWRDLAAAAAIIGVFAGGGFLFAIQGYRRRWTRPATYAGGGVLAMLLGVALLSGYGVLQGLAHGYLAPSPETVWSFAVTTTQLIALGVLPGLAGGLTFWLVARPSPKAA